MMMLSSKPVVAQPVPPDRIRLGVVMLCHDRLDIAAQMARTWHDGGAAVAVHIDRRTASSELRKMQADLAGCGAVHWMPRRNCDWGSFALVQATQDSAALLLSRFPDVTHVMVVSGSCLPLRPVAELHAFLARTPQTDYIESVNARDVEWAVGGLNLERFTLRFPFSFRRQRGLFDRYVALQRRIGFERKVPAGLVPHLGSQWWCLTRRTLGAILNDPRREEFETYFTRVWIPDESYFQTLCRRHAVHVANRTLTLARFDAEGRPYLLFDDHGDMLERSGCFVARKIWSGAEGLYRRFPCPAGADKSPDPYPIIKLMDRARQLRTNGRPGFYNQGRFPRQQETGKTASPYAIAYGFTDLFPAFQSWLAARLDADVHGHLFNPDMVEFAGGVRVGPGCLSDSPALRDRDPRSFLTSLVRSSRRSPVMMFSARDHRKLHWFFTTDHNMRSVAITGAWIMPMLDSGMPFDDIRRMAARLQRREVEGLKVLSSPWVRARICVWSLPQVLAFPGEVLTHTLGFLGGPAQPGTLPAMRSAEGLRDLLRHLSEAGLHPRRFGELTRPNLLTPTPLICGPA